MTIKPLGIPPIQPPPPQPMPCEDMEVKDFVLAWKTFLERLRDSGTVWIIVRAAAPILSEPLGFMWAQVLDKLIHLADSEEFREAINLDQDREQLCRVINRINLWYQTGGDDQLAFSAATDGKETLERWLGPRLSFNTNNLLKALNQLLCMLRCL